MLFHNILRLVGIGIAPFTSPIILGGSFIIIVKFILIYGKLSPDEKKQLSEGPFYGGLFLTLIGVIINIWNIYLGMNLQFH